MGSLGLENSNQYSCSCSCPLAIEVTVTARPSNDARLTIGVDAMAVSPSKVSWGRKAWMRTVRALSGNGRSDARAMTLSHGMDVLGPKEMLNFCRTWSLTWFSVKAALVTGGANWSSDATLAQKAVLSMSKMSMTKLRSKFVLYSCSASNSQDGGEGAAFPFQGGTLLASWPMWSRHKYLQVRLCPGGEHSHVDHRTSILQCPAPGWSVCAAWAIWQFLWVSIDTICHPKSEQCWYDVEVQWGMWGQRDDSTVQTLIHSLQFPPNWAAGEKTGWFGLRQYLMPLQRNYPHWSPVPRAVWWRERTKRTGFGCIAASFQKTPASNSACGSSRWAGIRLAALATSIDLWTMVHASIASVSAFHPSAFTNWCISHIQQFGKQKNIVFIFLELYFKCWDHFF